MKRTGICPKCGSKDIVNDAKAQAGLPGHEQHELIVSTFRTPQALIFKGQQGTPVSAWVCGGCGFVEYYADRPGDLKV